MSQQQFLLGAGGSAGALSTLTGNTGGPILPIAGNLNIVGAYDSTNNINGIYTVGSVGQIAVTLTNRYQASATFSDALAHTIFTFPMGAVPGMYLFKFDLIAFNNTTPLGAAYSVSVPLRTDGALGHSIIPQEFYEPEEGTMTNTLVTAGLQPATNNFFVSVSGYGVNKINWNLTGTYTFVSNI